MKKVVLFFCTLTLLSFSVLNKDFMRAYTKNGALQEEGSLENGSRVGIWTSYYLDGSIQERGKYQNNLKDSLWKNYF